MNDLAKLKEIQLNRIIRLKQPRADLKDNININ